MLSDQFLAHLSDFSDQFSKHKYWVSPTVFTDESLNIILKTFNEYRPGLRPSMVGKGLKKKKVSVVRNDLITWIDNDDAKLSPLWPLLEELKSKIRQELFVAIKRYEVQLALYPPGHYYLRHRDQHKLLPARVFTFVFYLNDWQATDAGELVLFKESKERIVIQPMINQMIIFSSDLEHEVLKTNKERKSITAWFRDDIL